jgi:hypothetical protein
MYGLCGGCRMAAARPDRDTRLCASIGLQLHGQPKAAMLSSARKRSLAGLSR